MTPDVVVVGAGHNGLVCAATLARAGRRVVVVEGREVVGGCAATEDALGARVSLCSCDHSLVLANPFLAELDLARHGLEYLPVDPALIGTPWEGGPPVVVFRDPERTVAAWRRTHPREAEAYRRYLSVALPAARLLARLSNRYPSPGALLGEIARSGGRGALTLLRWKDRSLADVAGGFFDDERVVRPLAVTTTGVWGVPPSAPGTGLAALTYALRHVVGVARPRGGSGMLAVALASSLAGHGGTVVTGSRVTRIVPGPDGTAVHLDDGTVISAPVVVSAIDPHLTVERLLDGPPAELSAALASAPPAEGYQSKLDLVVRSVPDLPALDVELLAGVGVSDPFVPSLAVSPSLEDIEELSRLRDRGRIGERPMMLVSVPSVLDPTLRAGDDHVLSVEILWTPYRLAGGWSPEAAVPLLDRFSAFAGPGFRESVVSWRAMTPPAYEEALGLNRGNPPAFGGDPLTVLRGGGGPLARYATPVPGLYLTGAGTYPGGGVWGAAGRNAALRILAET